MEIEQIEPATPIPTATPHLPTNAGHVCGTTDVDATLLVTGIQVGGHHIGSMAAHLELR